MALLAYPLLVERYLPLSAHAGAESLRSLTQSGLWCAGFLIVKGVERDVEVGPVTLVKKEKR